MRNFDYLKKEPVYQPFADPAIAAERVFAIDPSSSMINIRKAVEQALKFVFRQEHIIAGEKDNLVSMLHNSQLQEILPEGMIRDLDIIRMLGNQAVHTDKKVEKRRVVQAFMALYEFLDWIAYGYVQDGNDIWDPDRKFVPALLLPKPGLSRTDEEPKTELSKQTADAQPGSRNKQDYPMAPRESETRKLYIDLMLENAGWKKGTNWLEEVSVSPMPTKSGKGNADYVLYGQDGMPLAVLEAKKTTADLAKGRQQASLYADALEKQCGRRPVIFLSNGMETRIIDGMYPERKVADVYSPRDLEKLFNLRSSWKPLTPVHSSDAIAGRYYQKQAIAAICERLERKKRKALLVMATGSGKTRTAAALIDWLVQRGWVRNVLFLADRKMLVSQAKAAMEASLPDLSVTNLCDGKNNPDARIVVSTYQTIMNCIDTTSDNYGRIFTPGHFDLIICDEVHRSIYNKYRDIFNYFDAPMIGLTATPKNEVDRNTYQLFELPDGNPTFAYSLEDGVRDHYLVDYETVETGTKFIKEGIRFDDLTEEEQEDYEERFADEDGRLPEKIDSAELNKTLFNRDTIRKVLGLLMDYGLHVDCGSKLGKTIVFARNHEHAEKILEVFHQEYPELGNDFAQIIDFQSYDPETLKRNFSDPDKLPQIAISVDMLDTGVDVPSVLNLVFFKKVFSKTKFWQMIGRGTRLCEGLIDGKDKEKFLIFDFLGNFEYFSETPNASEPKGTISIQEIIFSTIFQMVYKLQREKFQTPEYRTYRDKLILRLASQVQSLNRSAFNVHQHLDLVDRYLDPDHYRKLVSEDVMRVRHELAPLIQPPKDSLTAVRFDSLIFRMELDILCDGNGGKGLRDLKKKADSLLKDSMDIPEVAQQRELLEKCTDDEYLSKLTIWKLEEIRHSLRDLMKYIVKEEARTYETDYQDTLQDMQIKKPTLVSLELDTYKERMRKYIRAHEHEGCIMKLKENLPLTYRDYSDLQKALWEEAGTKADYEAEYADKPLGPFVRSITGLDQRAAKEVFAKYIDEAELNSEQIQFVNEIIDYLVRNGTMDLQVLQQSPFTDRGGIVGLFGNEVGKWMRVKQGIDEVNRRAHPFDA
ncbi:DEAD/DEAH box helicase family protein [uncultured Faecalibaculum sp.]|uniref:DEAD/DEAH box helicase family protein n=1 Tax=uncultured Faecalibaculum sp. TaxID=1729681 RepID=UPI0025F5F58E|nr:DEAD/DEAH box helicase family protein [uncultured Faecalibaculum sp.]